MCCSISERLDPANDVMRLRIAGSRVRWHGGEQIHLAQVVKPVIRGPFDEIPDMAGRVVRCQELTQNIGGWHLLQPSRFGTHQLAVRLGFFRGLRDPFKCGAGLGDAALRRAFSARVVRAKIPDRHPTRMTCRRHLPP